MSLMAPSWILFFVFVSCSAKDCTKDEFLCVSDKTCVPNTWVCDFVNDCPEGEDELDCDGKLVSYAATVILWTQEWQTQLTDVFSMEYISLRNTTEGLVVDGCAALSSDPCSITQMSFHQQGSVQAGFVLQASSKLTMDMLKNATLSALLPDMENVTIMSFMEHDGQIFVDGCRDYREFWVQPHHVFHPDKYDPCLKCTCDPTFYNQETGFTNKEDEMENLKCEIRTYTKPTCEEEPEAITGSCCGFKCKGVEASAKFDGTFWLNNVEWKSDYDDSTSSIYQDMEKKLQVWLEEGCAYVSMMDCTVHMSSLHVYNIKQQFGVRHSLTLSASVMTEELQEAIMYAGMRQGAEIFYTSMEKTSNGCRDRYGVFVQNGSNFEPTEDEPCMNCVCNAEAFVKQGGYVAGSMTCIMTMCEEPKCEIFQSVRGTCCEYNCLDYAPLIAEFRGSATIPDAVWDNDLLDETTEAYQTLRNDTTVWLLEACDEVSVTPCRLTKLIFFESSVGMSYTLEASDTVECSELAVAAVAAAAKNNVSLADVAIVEIALGLDGKGGVCHDARGFLVPDTEVFHPLIENLCHVCVCNSTKYVMNKKYVEGEFSCAMEPCDPPTCPGRQTLSSKCCDYWCPDVPLVEPSGRLGVCMDVAGFLVEDEQPFKILSDDPCQQCTCDAKKYLEMGKYIEGAFPCATPVCAAPACQDYSLVEGQCCDYWCPGETADHALFRGIMKLKSEVWTEKLSDPDSGEHGVLYHDSLLMLNAGCNNVSDLDCSASRLQFYKGSVNLYYNLMASELVRQEELWQALVASAADYNMSVEHVLLNRVPQEMLQGVCRDRNGRYVARGGIFIPAEEPCQECVCDDGLYVMKGGYKPGMFNCTTKTCPSATCPNPQTLPGTCCSYWCFGDSGHMIQSEEVLAVTDRTHGVCDDYRGFKVNENSIFYPMKDNPCYACYCDAKKYFELGTFMEGKFSCLLRHCPEPSCSDYVIIPDSCCEYWCPGDDRWSDTTLFRGIVNITNGVWTNTELSKARNWLLEGCHEAAGKFCSMEKILFNNESHFIYFAMRASKSTLNLKLMSDITSKASEHGLPITIAVDRIPRGAMEDGVCRDKNGNYLSDGQMFTPSEDPCMKCKCDEPIYFLLGFYPGWFTCTSVACEQPKCGEGETAELIEGSCCGYRCYDEHGTLMSVHGDDTTTTMSPLGDAGRYAKFTGEVHLHSHEWVESLLFTDSPQYKALSTSTKKWIVFGCTEVSSLHCNVISMVFSSGSVKAEFVMEASSTTTITELLRSINLAAIQFGVDASILYLNPGSSVIDGHTTCPAFCPSPPCPEYTRDDNTCCGYICINGGQEEYLFLSDYEDGPLSGGEEIADLTDNEGDNENSGGAQDPDGGGGGGGDGGGDGGDPPFGANNDPRSKSGKGGIRLLDVLLAACILGLVGVILTAIGVRQCQKEKKKPKATTVEAGRAPVEQRGGAQVANANADPSIVVVNPPSTDDARIDRLESRAMSSRVSARDTESEDDTRYTNLTEGSSRHSEQPSRVSIMHSGTEVSDVPSANPSYMSQAPNQPMESSQIHMGADVAGMSRQPSEAAGPNTHM